MARIEHEVSKESRPDLRRASRSAGL